MNMIKRSFIAFLCIVYLSGCATTLAVHISNPDGETRSDAHTSDVNRNISDGFKNFIGIIALCVLVGVIYTYAPKEAYR